MFGDHLAFDQMTANENIWTFPSPFLYLLQYEFGRFEIENIVCIVNTCSEYAVF